MRCCDGCTNCSVRSSPLLGVGRVVSEDAARCPAYSQTWATAAKATVVHRHGRCVPPLGSAWINLKTSSRDAFYVERELGLWHPVLQDTGKVRACHRDAHPRWCRSCHRETGKGPSVTWRQMGSGPPRSFMSDGPCGEEGSHGQTVRGIAAPVLCFGEGARCGVPGPAPLRRAGRCRSGPVARCCLRAFAPDRRGFPGCRPTAGRQVSVRPLLFTVGFRTLTFYPWKNQSRKGEGFPTVPRWAGAARGVGRLPCPSPVLRFLARGAQGCVGRRCFRSRVPGSCLSLSDGPVSVCPRPPTVGEPSVTTPPLCPPHRASASGSCGSRPLLPPTHPPPSASSRSGAPTYSR